MKDNHWSDKAFSFIWHNTCEYFPCHEIENTEDFNCLFCYCPLYPLRDDCGGNPSYTQTGIKNCSNCNLPHKKENYGLITHRLKAVVDKCKKGKTI